MAKVDIDTKLQSINEQKQVQLEKLNQLKNQEKDLKAQQRKQKRELTRQQDTRLKILVGAFYLRQFNKNPELLESIKNDLINFVSEAVGTAEDQTVVVLKELLNIDADQVVFDWNT